ncbi:hypothetical protein BD779DRAFT_958875 [Infundibulicybe gibba]|nr:hypothetical protein BD779DRAFT_958875 [Infundibulicybe gibba]
MATVLNPPSSPFVFNPVSPFTEGVLSETHNSQIIHIRTCLQTWLQGVSDLRKGISGARERFSAATQALADLEVAAPYAFTPEPEYRFQRSLLSCVRCYWIALIASFSASEKDEMMHRLTAHHHSGNASHGLREEVCGKSRGSERQRVRRSHAYDTFGRVGNGTS